jgi:hypothetical protein
MINKRLIKQLIGATMFVVGGLILIPTPEAQASGQSIYIVERPDGSVTFTSRKPLTGKYKIFTPSDKGVAFSTIKVTRQGSAVPGNKEYYEKLIVSTAKSFGVDPHLVKAVVQVESSFNPSATSKKGAMGLMQLMPETAKFLSVKDPYDPAQNIRGGTKYLKQLLDKFDGNIGLSLAAYNAGEYSIQKHDGIPPYRETISYVRKVVELREQFRVGKG